MLCIFAAASSTQSRLMPEDTHRSIYVEPPEQHTLNIIMVTSVGSWENHQDHRIVPGMSWCGIEEVKAVKLQFLVKAEY